MPETPTPSSPPASPPLVPEFALIRLLNIAAKKIRALRPASVEVRHAEGVFWPMADARALATHLGVTLEVFEKMPAPDGIETMRVVSTARGGLSYHFPNPNIIRCERLDGSHVDVRVKDSRKYRPTLRLGGEPMTLQARKAESGNWWVLVGNEPRWVAQW